MDTPLRRLSLGTALEKPHETRKAIKMDPTRLNFQQWQARTQQSPQDVVDMFLAKLQELPTAQRHTWIAATPSRDALLDALSTALATDDLPLSGIPYALQDLFDVYDLPTACGAPFTELFDLPLDDSSRLHAKLTSLGATLFAKTVPAEFGIDPQGRNPTFGNCQHAANSAWVCGGGAGSAVRAVSAGLVPLAFGLDTAGGLRIPAAFHGLFGFRMENNHYARDGVFPMMPSIESVGWVNHCLADLRTTFEAFYPHLDYTADTAPRGYLISGLGSKLSREVQAGLNSIARELQIDEDPQLGTQLAQTLGEALTAYQTLEARELHSIHQYWLDEYHEQYAAAVLERLERGLHCPAAEAEICAQIQQQIRVTFSEFFERYDYLLLPICPRLTPELATWNHALEHATMQLIAPASLAFLPALILPFSCADGRHSAAQIILNPRKLHIVPTLLTQLSGK
jgi:aspartyl-tRNA(Asn)/glutamyl-tRNA(Gln) amidotransferase subunit A